MWLVLILVSAAFLAASFLLLKHDLNHEPNTQALALYPLAAVILLPFFTEIDYGLLFSATGWLIFVKTLFVALSMFCATLALKTLPVSLWAPLRNVSPIFLLGFGALFLGETVTAVQLLGLFVVITGAVLLDLDVRQRETVRQLKRFLTNKAVFLMLLSAMLISFPPVFDRLILRQADIPSALWTYYLVLAALYWATHAVTTRKLPFQGLERQEWLWLALTGLMFLVADVTYYAAVAIPGTILVVLIGIRRLSNLFVTLFGGHALHEDHLVYKGGLCLLMILGTVLLAT